MVKWKIKYAYVTSPRDVTTLIWNFKTYAVRHLFKSKVLKVHKSWISPINYE